MIADILSGIATPAVWIYSGVPTSVLLLLGAVAAFRIFAPEKYLVVKEKLVEWYGTVADLIRDFRKKG